MADETGMGRSENPPTTNPQSQATPQTAFWNGAPLGMPAQLGRYRIKNRLGGGGMGAVYLVENTELQRDEALKVPHFESGGDPAVRERFLREARAAAKLHHPNLCPIYHADVIDGIYFLTMCYLEGKLLSAYTGRPHPPREAVKIVAKLAQALEYAHGKGVIHRDLKPSNIMMCPGIGPTVMDFGLAKQTLRPDKKLTQTGMAMGTPAYMPPEQVKGELDRIGPASDVYNLGVILFELLTGRLPFDGSVAEVMGKVLFTETPLPSHFRPELDRSVDAVCGKAMAKAPEERYPSMKDFATALQGLLRTLPAKEETGPATAPISGKNAGDIFNMPTVPPVPPPVPKRSPESKRRPVSPDTIPEALPTDEPKAKQQDRKRRTGDEPVPEARRGMSIVVWFCLVLLLGGGSVGSLFLLLGSGRDRGANHTNDKNADKEARANGGPDGGAGAKEAGAGFTNDVGITLVSIPGGKFMMGSPKGEEGHGDDEEEHPVEVSPFHLGVHEVTQKQFRAVMGYNPSQFSKNARSDGVTHAPGPFGPGEGANKIPAKIPAGDDTEDYPAENVSWEEAKEFCDKLTARDTKKPAGHEYRLPREAEWEYACRGGTPSYQVFHFGNSLSSRQANFNGNQPYGGADKADSLNRTCKVGSYEKNRFGLYDMHGNVWEWCLDWYDKDYYRKSPPKDPPGPARPPPGGSRRVFRGGSWNFRGRDCRSAIRIWNGPGRVSVGFRVALVPSGK
jgi:formylglycine-generating enzyme required for sulfatase activity/serine/threonine protein kinase